MGNLEQLIFETISYGGTAKAIVYEAMEEASKGNFEQAEALLKEADENLVHSHQIQTDFIHAEARGEKTEISVLFVHAQDHLMTALEVRSLAETVIAMYKRLHALEAKVNG